MAAQQQGNLSFSIDRILHQPIHSTESFSLRNPTMSDSMTYHHSLLLAQQKFTAYTCLFPSVGHSRMQQSATMLPAPAGDIWRSLQGYGRPFSCTSFVPVIGNNLQPAVSLKRTADILEQIGTSSK